MKNFIVIEISAIEPLNLCWGNNEQELTSGPWLNYMEIEIHQCRQQNTFWIKNFTDSSYEIQDIKMYGFGQGKLKHWGRFQTLDEECQRPSHVIGSKGCWSIDWQYPTFTWLHKSLHMGWLVKPVQ